MNAAVQQPRRDWATRWKRRNIVPWKCTLCAKENAYGVQRCVQCGKLAPKTANLRVQDAAATLVQGVVRQKLARLTFYRQCERRVRKRFDRSSGSIFLENADTGVRLVYVHNLLIRELPMDEREEVDYEEFQRKQHDDLRLKLAFTERETKRDIERDAKRNAEEQAAVDELANRWAGPLKAAAHNGELIANWLRFTEISPLVWDVGPQLTLMRLIGNPLVRLPGSLFMTLARIEILSLSNCGLVELPDELTTLPHLRDLNVMRNQLERLPARLGDLVRLEALHVSCNKLRSLPESIGQLRAMPRLGLEQNEIPTLPDSIVDLNCSIMSWTRAGLQRLPDNIAAFGDRLVSLTADHNRIRRIPKGIGELVQLKHLSLCNNLIKYIPDEICKCKSLERLWLDWNQISELPPDFPGLESLQSIHLEGNPMRVPQMDVVVQGVPVLRAWFASNISLHRDKERKYIVEQLQSLLAILAEEGLHDPALCVVGMKTEAIGDPAHDLYFAFAPGYLRDAAIPRYNAFVAEISKSQAKVEARRHHYARRQELAERQELLELELTESLTLDSLRSAPTPKPKIGEKEHESALDDEVDDEAAQQQQDWVAAAEQASNVRKKEIILEELATTRTALYGQFGASHTDTRTPEQDRIHRTRLALSKVRRFLEPFEYSDADVADALEHFQDRFGKVFVTSQPALFRRCKCSRDGEPRLCVPPNLYFNCERQADMLKIGMVTYFTRAQRDTLNEEARVLEQRLDEVDKQVETYAASEKGGAFFGTLASTEAASLLEQERREKFVLRRQVRLERKRRKRHNGIERRRAALLEARNARIERLNKVRFKHTAELERLRGWEAKECQNKIREIDDDLENHPQDMALEILKIEQEQVDGRFQTRAEAATIMRRYKPRGAFFAFLHEKLTLAHARRSQELRKKLEHAYALAERRRVSLDTHREYRILRRIMFNWMHLGVRMTFESWRLWTRRNVYWRKYLVMEEENQRELEKAANDAEAIFQQAEFAKWVEHIDPFSDLPYWEHSETREIRHDPPVLEECEYIPRVPVRRGSVPAV